jgi:hypothetical protein
MVGSKVAMVPRNSIVILLSAQTTFPDGRFCCSNRTRSNKGDEASSMQMLDFRGADAKAL